MTMDNKIYEADWNLKDGLSFSITGKVDVDHWNQWFERSTYGQYSGWFTRNAEKFFAVLYRMYAEGHLEGYGFLFEMPEWDMEEWIRKAHRDCHRLWKADPKAFPAGGIKDSFDRLRAFRKAKSKAKKEASKTKKSEA